MKNFKRLVAIALSVVMICALSTVTFAATIDNTINQNYKIVVNKATITQGTTEFTVDIGLKDLRGETIDFAQNEGSFASFDFRIAAADIADQGLKLTGVTSTIGTNDTANMYIDGEYVIFKILFDKQAVQAKEDVVIATLSGEINANAAVGTYKIKTDVGNQLYDAGTSNSSGVIDRNNEYDLVTVNAAAAKTDSTVSAGTPQRLTLTGSNGKQYTNVWKNAYTITLGTKTITAARLQFAEKAFTDINVGSWTGDGDIIANFVVVGAPVGATADLILTQE